MAELSREPVLSSTSKQSQSSNAPHTPAEAAPPQRWYVNLEEQTYGPFDPSEIARMVGRQQVIGSDLVYPEGGTAWARASDDPTLGTLFRGQARVASEPRRAVQGPSISPAGGRSGKGTALVDCLGCTQRVSDQAESCPHCGHPVKSRRRKRRAPVFLILGACALALSLQTPRLLLFFPIMSVFAFAVISLFRRERVPAASVVLILFAIGIAVLNEVDLASPTSSNLSAAKIEDWNWRQDPSFGSRGTIKWNVKVRNISDRNISSAKIELTTYDSGGKLVASTFTYVQAIPPGEARSSDSFADLYRTEQRAVAQLTEVRFAR